jgi:flagellar FliL protein
MKLLIQCVLLGLSFTGLAWASSSGPKFTQGVNYIDVTPPLIVNYGGTGKMRYIKAEISIRTEDMKSAEEITHHLPLIRDKLISILSQQTEDSVATAEAKEKLRLFALAEVNKAVKAVKKGPESDKVQEKKKNKKSLKDDKTKKTVDTKSKEQKDKNQKAKNVDETDQKEIEVSGPASDLFFTNFVVQK